MRINLAYQLVDKSRLVRRRFDESVRCHDLTGPQARLLMLLEREPGASQTSYAEALEIEPITLCRMADRLEERGWLTRIADPDDRRVKLLQPTEKSREITGQLRDTIDMMLEELLSDFETTERDELARLLAKIGGNAVTPLPSEAING